LEGENMRETDMIFLTFIEANSLQNVYNILLSKLNQYVDEITADHQCVFLRNISITNHNFAFIRYCRKMEYNEAVQKFFRDFKKDEDSVRKEV
jgi:hypothetical protein